MSEYFDGYNWEKIVNGWDCTADAVKGGWEASATYINGVEIPGLAAKYGDQEFTIVIWAENDEGYPRIFSHADEAMKYICDYAENHGAAVIEELKNASPGVPWEIPAGVHASIPLSSRLTTIREAVL